MPTKFAIPLLCMVLTVLPGCQSPESSRPGAAEAPSVVPMLQEVNQPLRLRTARMGEIILEMVPGQPPPDGGFRDDYLVLQASDSQGSMLLSHHVQSSYGAFRLEAVDLDSDGRPELVLITGMGRGTSVRSERLEVLRLRDGRLVQVAVAPYSGYFGSGVRWWYTHEYVDTDADGRLDIRLVLDHDALGAGPDEYPEEIPKETSVLLRTE